MQRGTPEQLKIEEEPDESVVAKKEGAREWLRLTGIAEECKDVAIKERFMEMYNMRNFWYYNVCFVGFQH